MKLHWEWLPNKSLGPINIGSNINEYRGQINWICEGDANGWEKYILPDDDVYIHVQDKKIIFITAYEKFYYKGKNLIGMNLIALGNLLGCTADDVDGPIVHEDGDEKTAYDYDDFGLQVWTSKGVITSASCSCDQD